MRELLANPNAAVDAGARARIHAIVDDLPEEALPLVAAMLEELARHYEG